MALTNANNETELEAKEASIEEMKLNKKLKLLMDYFSFYTQPIYIKVVDFIERPETSAEVQKRKELTEKHKQEQLIANPGLKSKKTSINVKKEEDLYEKPLTVNEIKPNNLVFPDKTLATRYFKWISSQIQAIKDLNILDCNTGESIWQKIYPQENGIPIYNPRGQYWVKLFHMGKYRKIEIDDRMLCGKNDELLMPRCENLDEVWPALISKALLKLFSYKYKLQDYFYEEVGDTSIIYALTGYIGEKIEQASLHDSNTLLRFNLFKIIKFTYIIRTNPKSSLFTKRWNIHK